MGISTVISRHPRYSTLLVLVLLAVTFLLYPSHPSIHGPGGAFGRPVMGGHGRLQQYLRQEEDHYNKVLADRESLVRKWGPTASQVKAFPPKDDFYTLWDFFIPAFQCPHHVERVGTMGDGGKWVCGLDRIAKQRECTIYSFGVNGESSFEATLLERAPGCQVWGYDFSVSSFGPEIEDVPNLKQRSHFYPYALGPKNDHGPGVNPPMYTLTKLMEINGHDFIDILKIDIEGAEFESLITFIEDFATNKHPHAPGHNGGSLPIGQLQIEIHAREDTHYHEFAPFKRWWERLEKAGLRPFWTEPNLVYVNLIRGARPDLTEYSFMNIRGDHALVSERFN